MDADEALRAAGLPDDDSTPEAEEALEDEGLGPKRRTRPQPEADAGILPHALAASEASDVVWIATSSGVFRGDETGCLPAGLDGRDLLLVAAAGGAVVAATDDLLFKRWPEVDRASDEGKDDDSATFTVVAGLNERPRRWRSAPTAQRSSRTTTASWWSAATGRPRESSIARPMRWRSATAWRSRWPMTASTAGRLKRFLFGL